MSINTYKVTRKGALAALDSMDLSSAHAPWCQDYYPIFFKCAAFAESEGNLEVAGTFRILWAIASFNLKPDLADPFVAFVEGDGGRSPILSDLDDDEIRLISSIAGEIQDADLRARACDCAWIRLRDFKMAGEAIKAYLVSMDRLLKGPYPSLGLNRIKRAIHLATSLGRNHASRNDVQDFLKKRISNGAPADFTLAHFLELLLNMKETASGDLATLSENSASQASTSANFILARKFWDLAAKCHAILGNEDRRISAKLRAAETYVEQSNEPLQRTHPSYLTAASFIASAMEALRQIPNTKERQKELHKIMLEYQNLGANELIAHRSEVDLTDLVQKAEAMIEGKSLEEAIRILALASRPQPVELLRQEATRVCDTYLSIFLFPSVTLDDRGKVINRSPGSGIKDSIAKDATVLHQMFKSAEMNRGIRAVGFIEPIRRRIELQFNVELANIIPLVTDNPFVPTDRIWLYARAILLGLQGQLCESTHILVPQIENSIRYLLQQEGTITSGFDSDGIQDDFDLNKTLYMEPLKAVLGEDMVFELRGIFVERSGANFRNRLAHGLLGPGDLFSQTSLYVWWLSLHLCHAYSSQSKRKPENEC